MMFNIIDYAILITLLYNSVPLIDFLIDNIGKFIIYTLNYIFIQLIDITKIIIKYILYYLMLLVYTLWIILFVNIIVDLFFVENYSKIINIYEKYNNTMSDIYIGY